MKNRMEKIPVSILIPDDVRRAISMFAAEHNLSIGQVIEWMASDYLPEQLVEARKAIAAGVPAPKRRGRPPKKPEA